MTLSAQMYSLLSGSTSVTSQVGTRVYPVTLPQDVRFPAVRYTIVSNIREWAMTDDTGDVTARVQITSWGRTPDEAETVSEGVRAAVQRTRSVTSTLHDEFVQLSDGNNFNPSSSGQEYLYQTWQSAASPNELTSVAFRMKRLGSPTGTMRAIIYAHTGTYGTSGEPTGSPLVISDSVDVSTVSATYADQSFTFRDWVPAASTNYVVVLDMSGGTYQGAVNDLFVVYETAGDGTHAGNSGRSADGASWLVLGGVDLAFKVYTGVQQESFLENELVDYDDSTGVYAHSLDVIVHYTE
jgi:hypothetical protein